MIAYRCVPMLAAALVLAWVPPGSASGQMLNLPPDDFTWRWGVVEDDTSSLRRFSTRGTEAHFSCELTGSIKLGSRITTRDVRKLESDLGTNFYFIYNATIMMNNLDYQQQLAWAVLDCKIPQEAEGDPAETQERLDRLRERALRRQSERRERDNDD